MRTMLQLLLGLVLTVGISTSAHAVGFNLQFAAPGADCALDGVAQNTDCNDGDITDADGNLHFAIGGGDQLRVTAYNTVTFNADRELNPNQDVEIIQDFPALGGLAVNGPNTDQVEPGQALLFELLSGSTFVPIPGFTDDHAAIPNPGDRMVRVIGFVDGVGMYNDSFSMAALIGGALIGAADPAINGWLLWNDSDRGDWYVSSMKTIPEPGTAMLLGLGLTGLAARRRKGLA